MGAAQDGDFLCTVVLFFRENGEQRRLESLGDRNA